MRWFKSSYSGSGGGNCVEVGWHKSSYSANGGECVEVTEGQDVLVRDTKYRQHGHLSFRGSEWSGLIAALRRA